MYAMEETVFEILLETERFNYLAKEKSRSGSFGLGSGERFRAGQSSSGMGLGDAFHFSHEVFACVMRLFRISAARSVSKVRRGAAPDHHCHFPRVDVELLASTYCVAGRIE